jgi:hypothetical protein
VYRTHRATGLPLAILRPSLVTGVAGLPRPGYCGNWAGPSGMGAAVAIGFFPALSAHAVQPFSVWDAVPGDLVASAILATAAAVGAGLQRELSAATGSGAWLTPAAARGHAAAVAARRAAVGAGGAAAAACGGGAPGKAGLLHARNGSLSAFTDDTAIGLIAAARAPPRCCGASGSGSGELSPTARSSEDPDALAAPDQSRGRALATPPKGGAPAAAAAAAAGRLGAGGPAQPLLIVHATTSTTYPATVYEAYNTAVDFLKAHGSPNSMLVGGARWLPNMPPTWRPSPRMVQVRHGSLMYTAPRPQNALQSPPPPRPPLLWRKRTACLFLMPLPFPPKCNEHSSGRCTTGSRSPWCASCCASSASPSPRRSCRSVTSSGESRPGRRRAPGLQGPPFRAQACALGGPAGQAPRRAAACRLASTSPAPFALGADLAPPQPPQP